MKRNIILFGATGKTGFQIYKELRLRDIKSSVFVREESINKLKFDDIQIIIGDVLNMKDVEAAFNNESFTDVIIALGSKALKKASIRTKGTQYIINAMKLKETKSKIHLISAFGVGDSWNQLNRYAKLMSNILLKSVIKDHQQQEELVKNSSHPYHIIRPVGLKNGEALGGVHVQNEGFLPRNTILRADLAKYLVESMIENKTGVNAVCQK